MWAWRSLLNCPQPLLSRLRSVRHHAGHQTAVLGSRNSLIASRSWGYASNSAGANWQHPVEKRHLYVVLDDSKDRFGIHRLDVGDEDLHHGAQRLPEPPFLRVAFPHVEECTQFAAVGSSIVALATCCTMHILDDEKTVGGVFIYDTKTGVQVFSPQLPKGFLDDSSVYQAAIPAGNRLYMFESSGSRSWAHVDKDLCPPGLHCLTAERGGHGDEFWNWRPLSPSSPWQWDNKDPVSSPSSPWCWSDDWNPLFLPFYADCITAHAVRMRPGAAPHEHEIFVSVSTTRTSEYSATFFFDTPRRQWMHRVDWEFPFHRDKTLTAGWTRRGDWRMPIISHAHYDDNLDTWIRLHDGDFCCPGGFLCAGHVTSAPSEWKVSKEKLSCLDEDTTAGLIHRDAKLMPMASTDEEAGTEYCLMERLIPWEGDFIGDGDKCLLRLTTFHVKRGENGEPVATASRPARSYKLSMYNRLFEAQALWM